VPSAGARRPRQRVHRPEVGCRGDQGHNGKAQAAAEETTKVMERTYSTASKGAADFNLHLLEMAQANMNAGLRLCSPTNARQIAHGISRAVDRARAQAIRNVQRTNTATHDLAQKATSDAAQPLSPRHLTRALDGHPQTAFSTSNIDPNAGAPTPWQRLRPPPLPSSQPRGLGARAPSNTQT
jgi:hypothetical protein